MSKFSTTASRLKGMWTFGALVILLLLSAGAGIGVVVAMVLTVAWDVLGWSDGAEWTWLALSAIFWLPIAVGNAFR